MDRKRFRIARAFHWLLGAILVWASLSKLGDLQSFYGALLAYQLPLPDALLQLIAIVLPWVELFCGLMLLANYHAGAALTLSVTLFAVFAVATGQAWYRGLELDCGCLSLELFGVESNPAKTWIRTAPFAFWRTMVLLLIGVALVYHELKEQLTNKPAH